MKKDRLSELEMKIKAIKLTYHRQEKAYSKKSHHLLPDLMAGLTVGSLLGYNLDSALSTKPLFLFLFVVLGVCGGFYNFYKLEIKKHTEK